MCLQADYLELKLSLMVSYDFCVTLQVSWHPMWKTPKNIMHVCVCAQPLGVKSCGVYLTVREHPPFSLSVGSRERERGRKVAFQWVCQCDFVSKLEGILQILRDSNKHSVSLPFLSSQTFFSFYFSNLYLPLYSRKPSDGQDVYMALNMKTLHEAQWHHQIDSSC